MVGGKFEKGREIDEGLGDHFDEELRVDEEGDLDVLAFEGADLDDDTPLDPIELLDDEELDALQAELDAHREASLGAVNDGVFVPREPAVEHYLGTGLGMSVRRISSGAIPGEDFMPRVPNLPSGRAFKRLERQARRDMEAASRRLDKMGNPGGGGEGSVNAVVDMTRANFDTTDGSMLFRPEEWQY
ncbi:hypothetical protein HY605_00485 [Candidatus Peregrinibacteria bacterium]|nr:hypothetical protein [Candidatus Peregrinibacteria bacterium]